MVKHGEVDCFAGPGQLAGCVAVGSAWPGISARMVMGNYHAGAAQPQRIGDDFTHGKADDRDVAHIMLDMDAARTSVNMCDQELLP